MSTGAWRIPLARAWVNRNGIPFTEHDVKKSETGKTEFRRMMALAQNGRMRTFRSSHLPARSARRRRRPPGSQKSRVVELPFAVQSVNPRASRTL